MKIVIVLVTIFILFGFSFRNNSSTIDEWKAPLQADKLTNPLKGDASATAEGKIIYMQMCIICHGDKGKGDGVAGVALNPKPGNFVTQKVQAQTDGALFWKITEGRPPMASYKGIFTETQRWQLVNYIRTFNATKK